MESRGSPCLLFKSMPATVPGEMDRINKNHTWYPAANFKRSPHTIYTIIIRDIQINQDHYVPLTGIVKGMGRRD